MAGLQGSIVGRYQIAGFLARGGKSIIYEALAPDTGRRVALKILPPSTARDPDRVEAFLRLAAKLAKLDHANLLPVVDYGREDGVPFSVSPIAQGGRLQDDLDSYRDPQTSLVLVLDLAQAVDHLHQNQILHGRIGPDHVLFDTQGEPLLTGAGWPYTSGDPGPAPAYLAPEQIQGQAPDERTDVYQLTALLHHLLLGQPPDLGDDLSAAYQAAGLDEHLAAVLIEALQPAPEDRFQTAADLAEQLSLVGQQLAVAGVDPDDGVPEDRSLADEPPDDVALDVEAPADELLDEDLLTDESLDDELLGDELLGDELLGDEPLGDEPLADESLDEDLLIDQSLDDELPEPAMTPAAPQADESAAPEQAAPIPASLLPLRDRGALWQVAAFAGLAVLLALCCLLAAFAVYSVSGRLRQPSATAQVDTNVRAGPSIEYQIVGILRAGQQADIYGVSPDGNWWQIAFDGAPSNRGWVPAAFVNVEELGNVAVIEPPPIPGAASP